MMKRTDRERGAVALEMALVLPVLLLILVGILEFGRVMNVQVSLTQAAREGARHAAIHYDDGTLNLPGAALAAAPALDGLPVTVDDDADACGPGLWVEVTTSVSLPSMTGFLDAGLFPLDLEGIAVMQCGG
ncbi:Flp pilus assembly protein TadG [Arthrobacter sp. PL16]|uniref:TadE/TadG family type IV pilus assembly protein n=1 Tax=Arthrobacter sp. PL16 TaxID=3071720 RepID=UPI002DFF8D3A|nr:Flp pilus assembly protein TadG [Arthrobacter sp. PL16]